MSGDVEVITEVRSVNHRFLDISLRVPRTYTCFEPKIRRIVSERIQRGKIDLSITRSGSRGGLMDVTLDYGLAQRYHNCLVELRDKLGLSGGITVSDILALKEVVVPTEREEAVGLEWPLVEQSISSALDALDETRRAEGASLWRDIEARLLAIGETVLLVRPLLDQIPALAKERLAKRVQELTGGMELDQDRLLQEVALIADRADVTEELTRLESHVEQFLGCGKQGSPLGRKLDFLLQELHREVNTLGSKSSYTDIASHVVNLKTEVEKIREQTQNLE
jgi:uncharacterized protein (TIGR00255 family)